MPPIPIHRDSPIAPTTAAKPSGITPSTADASSPDSANETNNPPPTRTLPASVPATTTASADSNNPPAPQPGAFPVPRPTASTASDPPAPPQPGSTPRQVTATHHVTETRYSGPPPQSFIPTPTASEKQGRSTDTSAPAAGGPTTVNLGPVPLPVPSPFETGGGHPVTGPGQQGGYSQNQGSSGGAEPQEGGGGVADAAWNLLSKAGEALKKGEEAAWKAVRNK